MESHLLQMRGLKPSQLPSQPSILVASFTDAWIETCWLWLVPCIVSVASFTDAWIETRSSPAVRSEGISSHLLQMRGLKQEGYEGMAQVILSHLLQMRGLKLVHSVAFIYDRLSHLLQMRGLKPLCRRKM